MLKIPVFNRYAAHILVISALAAFAARAGFCGDSPTAGATSVSISSSTTIISQSSALVVTSTCAAGAGGVSTCTITTEEKLERIREKLPELRVQETVLDITPKMRIYLPSGAFDMDLKQQYRKTSMDFTMKYDFVDSFMGFGLDFLYDLSPLSLGLDFADTVDFSEIYSGTEYIERSQSVMPYVQRSLSKYTRVKTGVKFENTYTDAVASNFVLDRGKNILGEAGVYNDSIEESTSAPHGGSSSFKVQHSFQNLGSDYNYTQLEYNFKRYFTIFRKQYVECEGQAGYPFEVSKKPFTSLYYIGGYRILRGYKFKEFYGDALIYGTVKYNIPLNNPKEEDYFKHISVSFFTWNVFAEGAKIGTKDIYSTTDQPKFSAGTGFGYKIVLFRLFPIKLELSAAKAFEDRPVYFYFTVSTIYYTWRN